MLTPKSPIMGTYARMAYGSTISLRFAPSPYRTLRKAHRARRTIGDSSSAMSALTRPVHSTS
jgi:hypothetical protein